MLRRNILLATNAMTHVEQYARGPSKVYSYFQARPNKQSTVFFGLQYYLKEYLKRPITHEDVDEFVQVRKDMFVSTSPNVECKLRQLATLGYWPLQIKAVPEGIVIPTNNLLMTVTNTVPEFAWTVDFARAFLSKIGRSCAMATTSAHYRYLVDKYFRLTCINDKYLALTSVNDSIRPCLVHFFDHPERNSEESNMVSAMAHLTSFNRCNSVSAYQGLINYYGGNTKNLFKCIPTSEQSVMMSFGRQQQLASFRNMLEIYPTGIVSIAADTYNIWHVMTSVIQQLKDDILKRNGRVLFRIDSGNAEEIICGNLSAKPYSPKWKGCISLLEDVFGSTVGSRGYKMLNVKVGLIYGGSMDVNRFERILQRLHDNGYASSNVIIGIGSMMDSYPLNNIQFEFKTHNITINCNERYIENNKSRKSEKPYTDDLSLIKNKNYEYVTLNDVTAEQEQQGILKTVFLDGQLLIDEDFEVIRERVKFGSLLERMCL